MHMANELLTPGVALATSVLAAGAVGLCARAARSGEAGGEDPAVPLMGVLGAFVFAAQMVNVPVLPGASGHLVGTVLLAVLLGPARAVLVMTAVLVVQCLVFQDGGILALGCNVLNMGLVPAFLGAGVYRGLRGPAPVPAGRLVLGAFTAALLGVLAGAFLLPFPVAISGRSAVPLATFLRVMVQVHLPIGLVEGTVTVAALVWLRRLRPDLVSGAGVAGAGAAVAGAGHVPPRTVAATVLVAALVTAGVLSLAASELPDGLEYSLARLGAVSAPDTAGHPHPGPTVWTAVAGVAGTLLVLLIVWGVRALMTRKQPQRRGGRDWR